jgi:serine/threonine-protein kinase
MSPEQVSGESACVPSDLYALGLVLFEIFVGRPTFEADSLAEMLRMHREQAPPRPGSIEESLDPGLERLILRCLEKDPGRRPGSALEVAAALPGGDPLAALLAAGQTPPPEMVAASGRRGTLTRRRALQLAVLALAGIASGIWYWAHESLGDMVGGLLPPQVLEHRARQILTDLVHGEAPADTAWGYELDPRATSELSRLSSREARALVADGERPVVRYWYRQSLSPMAPWRTSLPGWQAGERVTPQDPPLTEPGMALVRLGPRGRLLELDVVAGGASTHARSKEAVVSSLLEAAGLDERTASQIEPSLRRPMGDGSQMAWLGPGRPGDIEPRRVEAAFEGLRPRWIRTVWPRGLAEGRSQPGAEEKRALAVFGVMYLGFLLGGAVLAAVNLRSGRWDRRGAVRLGIAVFVLLFVSTLIEAHHTLTPAEEARLVFSAVAYAATRALMTCLLYVAIEPFVRRLHPTILVSWSRLLSGRILDPAVGRDVLRGCAVGAAVGAVFAAWAAVSSEGNLSFPILALNSDSPLTAASAVARAVQIQLLSLSNSLGYLLAYVALRSVFGRARWAAPLGLWLLLLFLYAVGVGTWAVGATNQLVLSACLAGSITFLVVRCGLVATAVGMLFLNLPAMFVLTVHPTDWYFAPTAVLVGISLALVAFGYRTSTAGAPPFSSRQG